MRCCVGSRRAGARSSSSDDVVGRASGLKKDVDSVSLTANHLTVSLFALIVWVVFVTVALLAVAAVNCRRWRRQRRRSGIWEDDMSDTASICSRPTTDNITSTVPADPTAVPRDRTALENVEIGRHRSSEQACVSDSLSGVQGP